MELCENTLFILLIKKLTMKKLVSLFVVVFCLFVEGMSQTVCSFQREDNRVVLKMTDGELQLYPLSPNTLRVKFVKQSVGMEMPEWIYVNGGKEETFAIEEDKDAVSVVLPGIVAHVLCHTKVLFTRRRTSFRVRAISGRLLERARIVASAYAGKYTDCYPHVCV